MIIGIGIARPPPALNLQSSVFHRSLKQFRCFSGKDGDRFLNSVLLASPDDGRLRRMLRKFVASSSRADALSTLLRLTSPASSHPRLSSIALPLYLALTETSWFEWNSKLVANVIALLHKEQQFEEAKTLIAEAISESSARGKDGLSIFYAQLVDAQAKHQLRREVLHSCEEFRRLLLGHRRPTARSLLAGYQSMIKATCHIGMPSMSEKMVEEMLGLGLKVTAFEFRCLVYGYGQLGLFEEMKRVLDEMESYGFQIDRLTANMVLSSFGAHGQLPEMEAWLQKTKDSGMKPSIRTFNTVLNSCPKLIALLYSNANEDLPLSLEELVDYLGGDERAVVLRLVESSSLIKKRSMWASLDLHGMHLTTAYLFMLMWLDELRWICRSGGDELPSEIRVVCGTGSHSAVRSKSPVKELVKKMIVQMDCPLRNDSKRMGCYVAKGKVLRDWILSYKGRRLTQI